ncbi:MAG: hypothetical protein V9E88_04190 [Ferruginibacter sp.]
MYTRARRSPVIIVASKKSPTRRASASAAGCAVAFHARTSPVNARPFQPASTLSSVAGATRARRAANSAARSAARWASSERAPGGVTRASTVAPCSKLPALVTPYALQNDSESTSPSAARTSAGVHT